MMSGFQSTPPVSGRRCCDFQLLRLATSSLFQSTPPVSGRRCAEEVSASRGCRGFNPRPPFPGGDALPKGRNWQDVQVSIHAPRFREAMLGAISRIGTILKVSIHAPRFREAMPLGTCEN